MITGVARAQNFETFVPSVNRYQRRRNDQLKLKK